MAENLKCKCGAVTDKVGQPFTTASFRVHILQEARKDGKGIHGWATTREFSNPQEMAETLEKARELLRLRKAEMEKVAILTLPRASDDGTVSIEESARTSRALQEFGETTEEDDSSDLALEMDEIRYMLRVLRSEFDALKEQVGAVSVAWADAVPEPKPIDQEAVNLAQLDAMLGIDQPGPLDIKEQEIIAEAVARTGAIAGVVEDDVPVLRLAEKSGVPRGVFLILAFVAVVGVIVLVITQT